MDEGTITDCESCGQEKLCWFGPDPYQSEINYDNTEIWQCEDCAEQSRMDI